MPSFRSLSQSYNVQTLRSSPIGELSGSLGDLGTLLPLMIAMTLTGSIHLSTTLVFTGLANIITGLCFSVPLPVQPMKAIAAVAIANKFNKAETASAGLFVAAIIGAAAVCGLLNWITRVTPVPVIKGIQVGAGLTLVINAGTSMLVPLRWVEPAGDNLIWALAAFIALLLTTLPGAPTGTTQKGVPRIPYALAVFAIGIVIALVASSIEHVHYRHVFSVWKPRFLHIKPSELRTGSLAAGLGQLPLTALNSVIAVTHLSADLLPSQAAPTPFSLGISIAAFNLIGTPLGAMPICHGSGGLAAQYRFGARSGASIVVLGLVKLILGLVFSEEALVGLLQWFPKSLLGILVLASGMELASVGESLNAGARDLWVEAQEGAGGPTAREPDTQERKQRWAVMLVTVAGLLAFKNDAVGFLAGLLCHWAIHSPGWIREQRQSHRWRFGRGNDEERAGLLQGDRD